MFAKFMGKYLCRSFFFDKNFNKNETQAHSFFYEFYRIFKNTYFIENLQKAASVTRSGSQDVSKIFCLRVNY